MISLFNSFTGSPAYRRWFQETDFATYQENLEEENVHYNDHIEYPKYRIGYDKDCIVADKSPEAQNLGLDVESVVEVKIRGESHYGVIKSLNDIENYPDEQIAGIELVCIFPVSPLCLSKDYIVC